MIDAAAYDPLALEQASHELRFLQHELKNTLSAASFQIELLSRGRPRQRDRIEAVRDAIDQAMGLSNRLGMDPAESGTRSVEVASGVRQCVRLARAAVERRGDLVATIPTQIGETDLHEVEIRQVVLNLLLNAAEAIDDDGVVQVSVRPGRDGKSIEVEVADDGVGMSEETLACVFVPGFTKKANGTGLGLPRVRELVEKAGGKIRIRSACGEGTRVTIELPRVQREPVV